MHRDTRHISSVTIALVAAVLLVSLTSSVFAQRVVDKNGRVYYLGARHAQPGQVDPARILSHSQLAHAAGFPVGLAADNKTGLPPVGNQSLGNCTCWATGYYMKTYQEGQERGWGAAQLASQNNQASPKFLYNQVNGGGDTGAWSYMVMDLIADKGACSWTEMPEDNDWWTFPDRGQFEAAQAYRGNGGTQFFFWGQGNAGDAELAAMKAYLDAGNVFVIEVPVYMDSFVNVTGPQYLIDEPEVGDELVGYHAICVSGYDDDKQDNGGNTVGGFEFINSWSTFWGDSGFGWFSYNFVRNYADDACFMNDRNGYVPSHAGWMEIDHTDRSDLTVTVGVTPAVGSPWDIVVFEGDGQFGEGQPNYYGLADLTDAAAYLPPAVDCEQWFVGASDDDRHNTGTLNSLEVFQVGGGGSWTTTGSPVAIPDETGVPVYLTVFAGVGPDIDVSQTTLDLGTLTGPVTDDTTIQVENLGGYGCDWTLTESVPWLTITPTSGTLGGYGNQQLTIAVDPTGLAAGSPYHYSGVFTVERVGVPADTVDVTVEFDYPPDLAVNTNTVSLGSITHAAEDTSVYVYNTGGDTLDWTMTESVSWLTVAPASGTGLGTGAQDWLTVTVDPAGLTDGQYYSGTFDASRDSDPTDKETVTVDFTYYENLEVPGSYPTIQSAIDRALDGDVIHVAAGTYNENINFNGKNVVVQGVAGAATTIIDGGGVGSVVTLSSGEGNGAVLTGFTVQNGAAERGGGVHIDGASPTVSNNFFTGNTAVNDGGGIYASDGSPVLSNNELTANSAVSGGGICLVDAGADVDYQSIHGNNAELGGGFCAVRSSFTMNSSEVSDNTASAKGGGLYMVYASTPTMENNVIAGNTATTYGGGLYCGTACTLALSSTTLAGNEASNGGGIYLENTAPTINSTIVAFSTSGAGLYCAAAAPTITYCNAYGNMLTATTAANYVGVADPTGSNGNISADPLFHDADNRDYHVVSRAGRWDPALTAWVTDGASSPSIDGGDPALAFDTEPEPNGDVRNQGGYGNTLWASKTPGRVTITDGPSGDPNPVASAGDVQCSVTITVSEGHTVTYAWEAVDGAGDPAGSFDDDTAASPVWTAPANLTELNADYTISVTITCDDGGSVTDSYVQQVSPIEDTVAITEGPAGTPDPVASEGDVQCSVTAVDSRDHALTYGWQATDDDGDPVGSFDDVTAQNPVWTAPRNAGTEPAEFTIGVTVTCSQGKKATGEFTQTVSAEEHVLEITAGPSGDPNPVASAGQVQCSVTPHDNKGHALYYAWEAEDGDENPAGSFNDNTAQNPTWTAPENLTDTVQQYTISVTVTCSEGAEVTGSYVQSVSTVDHKLAISGGPSGTPNPVLSEGDVQCTVTAVDTREHDLTYAWTATDADTNPVGSFDDATARQPTWTAPLNESANPVQYTIGVTVTCAEGLEASGSYTEVVNPVVHTLEITAGPEGDPNPVASEGDVQCSVTAVDSVGHPLTYAWEAEDSEGNPAGSFDDSSAQNPVWTAPTNLTDDELAYTVTVTVTCSLGLETSASYVQRVSPVDDVVTITEGPAGDPNPAASHSEVACSVTATDSREHDLTYAWQATDSEGTPVGGFDDDHAQNPAWTAPENIGDAQAEYTLTVTVTCSGGIEAAGQFTQLVNAVGHIVQITAGPAGVPNPMGSEGAAQCSVTATCSHGHDLTYLWEAEDEDANSAGTFNDKTLQNPVWTAPLNTMDVAQDYTLTVTVSCSGGLEAEGSYTQTVSIVEHAINIETGPSGTPNPVASEGDVQCDVTAADTRADALTYAWEATDTLGNPAGAFDDATLRNPVWTAPRNETPSPVEYTITVTITCAEGLEETASFTEVVNRDEHLLEITEGPEGDPNPVASEGDTQCSVTAEDNKGHALTYLWTSTDGDGNAVGGFDDNTKQNPVWTAPQNTTAAVLDCTIGVTVTCSEGLEATASYVQHVSTVAHTLQITEGPAGDPNPVASGGDMQCDVTAVDSRDHDLTYAWTATDGEGNPAGSFDDASAKDPVWTAPRNGSGAPVDYTLSVTVTCAEGLEASGSFVATVEHDGHTLTIDAGYPQGDPDPCGYGQQVQCSVNATDSAGDALSYLWEAEDAGGNPAGTFNDNTLENPVWTAPLVVTDELREYTIRATVTCSAGLTAAGTYQQHVMPEPPAMPTDLAAALNEAADAVVLTWTDTSYNEEGFAVRRRMMHADGTWDPADWKTIVTLPANATTYTDSAVVVPNTYQYSIRSYNHVAPSNWTASVRISLATSAPNGPTNVSATAQVVVPPGQVAPAQGGDAWLVELTWQDNADNELGFTLQRRERQADGSWPTDGWATVAVLIASQTTFADDTVEANKEYQYRIRAFNDVGVSNWTQPARTATVDVAPDAPTGLTATVTGSSEIQLAWNDTADNESGYMLQRRHPRANGIWSVDDWATLATLAQNVAGYLDTSPITGRVYEYRVRAYNAAGASEWAVSAKVAITVSAPDSPTDLSAQVDGENNVLLTWTDVSNDELGFVSQRRARNADGTWPATWTTLQKVGPNVQTYTDRGEFPSEGDYQYRVRAYNDQGSSAWCANAHVTRVATVPATPTDMMAAEGAGGTIDLSWHDAATNEQSYKVQRRMQDADGAWPTTWNTLAKLGTDTEAYTDATPVAGKLYEYRVRAENYLGPSNWAVSNKTMIPINTPDAPTDLSALVDVDNNVELNWTDASGNEAGFQIDRRAQNADGTWPATWTTLSNVGPDVESYTDATEFPTQGDYQYRVRAYNAGGSSAWSSNARVTRLATVPAAPIAMAAAEEAEGTIDLSWLDPATNEQSYKVQRRMQLTNGIWPSAWDTLAVLPADTETYADATVVAGRVYQYRARAQNYLGPSNWGPTVVITAQSVEATHLFAAKARPYMIGLPAGADVDAAAIAYWDADAGRLVPVDGSSGVAGRGYWAQFARNAPVTANAGDATVVYRGLKRGWNLIASPYTTPIGFDGMSGPVLPIAWTDQGDGYQLAAALKGMAGVSAELQPWQSYWVYATADGDLTFRNSVESSGVVDVAANGAGWQIQIVATTGSDVDAANWCGVASGPAADVFNIPNPPQGNSAVDVYFGDERPMAAEVQAPADTLQFDFVVSSSAASPVTVQFPDLSGVPGGCALVLYDVEAGKSVNMWTTSAYTYSGKGLRHFRIEASRGNGNTLTIGSVSSQQTGGGVAVSYSLSTAAEVTVEVRNISGRTIRRIPCGATSAGLNTATWNLRSGSGSLVPSGTYLCTITARADDGTQTSAVRTIGVRR